MVRHTAEAMARGGIYGPLAGGFARYAVDATWTVPHFEKMLYDNALLLRCYTHLWRQTGDELARRVAVETADWMVAELRTAKTGAAVRWTRTATKARRAATTCGPLPSCATCWGRGAVPGPLNCSVSPSRALSNAARRCCSSVLIRTTVSGTPTSATGCVRPAPIGSHQPATTRW